MSQEEVLESLASFRFFLFCGDAARFRWMWAAIPFHVGSHYGDVGTCSAGAGQRDYCPAEFGIRGLPHAPAATVLHACHLGAKRFPVAFRDGRADHFVDDVGEVLQAGDGSPDPGIDHRDILAGRAQQDGARDLLQWKRRGDEAGPRSFRRRQRSWPGRKPGPGTERALSRRTLTSAPVMQPGLVVSGKARSGRGFREPDSSRCVGPPRNGRGPPVRPGTWPLLSGDCLTSHAPVRQRVSPDSRYDDWPPGRHARRA